MSRGTLVSSVMLSWAIGFAGAAQGDSLADQMTKGKLEADLGHTDTAIASFATVAADPAAPPPLQAEALVRLGAARHTAGDAEGSVAAFERLMKEHAGDEAAIRLLILATGGALPGKQRWARVWSQIQLGIDVTDPNRPAPSILWPDMPSSWRRPQGDYTGKVVRFTNRGAPPYTGLPVTLDFKDGHLSDVFRLFADISGLNVVVNPGVSGDVTWKGADIAWDDCLDRILSANGLSYQLNENVLHVAPVDQLMAEPARTFTGKAIDLDFHDRELRDSFRAIASHGNVKVAFGPNVAGHLTLKLNQVHWDQAFDVVARVNGLRWKRTGDTIFVGGAEEVVVK